MTFSCDICKYDTTVRGNYTRHVKSMVHERRIKQLTELSAVDKIKQLEEKIRELEKKALPDTEAITNEIISTQSSDSFNADVFIGDKFGVWISEWIYPYLKCTDKSRSSFTWIDGDNNNAPIHDERGIKILAKIFIAMSAHITTIFNTEYSKRMNILNNHGLDEKTKNLVAYGINDMIGLNNMTDALKTGLQLHNVNTLITKIKTKKLTSMHTDITNTIKAVLD